ncbi:hypothetical protein LINGRAHAP2_LOCUS20829, partial [Linum grandiflorum]
FMDASSSNSHSSTNQCCCSHGDGFRWLQYRQFQQQLSIENQNGRQQQQQQQPEEAIVDEYGFLFGNSSPRSSTTIRFCCANANKKNQFLISLLCSPLPAGTHSYLMEQLAKEGYLVISVPYNVTFDHASAANQVYERFNSCLDSLLENGLPDSNLTAADLKALPLFSVGHRPATEAVPYFEQFGPLVKQVMPVVEASPVYSMARTASGDAWNTLLDMAGAIIPENNQEGLVALTKFVDQLPSVMNQVTEGISEFKPTPAENRDCFKNLYNVQHTLLVKFISDTIDETDLLEEALKPRVESMGGTVDKIQLSGNHLTPCIQEASWEVGNVYTPADAVAQVLKSLSLSDTRGLAITISNWLAKFED